MLDRVRILTVTIGKHKFRLLGATRKPCFMLDLKALIVVREVGRCGSFGRAAQAPSYTPSAVSQRIAALERAHGVVLFERSPRGVRPTPAGRLLLRHVEQLLLAEEAAHADLVAAADLRRGLVRIGTFATAAAGFVADALRSAGSEYGLEFEVVEAEPYVLLPRLLSRDLDLAVVFSYSGQPASISFEGRRTVDESLLTSIQLGDDPLELVVPHGHRLADHASVRRAELREERFIPISPLMPTFADIERHLGFVPRFASAETADYAAVLGFVAAGLGIALAPRMVLDQMRRDDVVGIPLAGRPIRRRVDVVSATIERRPDRTAERVTIDALLAAASVRLSVRGLADRRSRASRRAP